MIGEGLASGERGLITMGTLYMQYQCINGFPDPKNLGIDTKINFLSPILTKLCGFQDWRYSRMTAILFLAHKKFSPRVPDWHPTDSCSGHAIEPESTIKHHPYHKICFIKFHWTIMNYKDILTVISHWDKATNTRKGPRVLQDNTCANGTQNNACNVPNTYLLAYFWVNDLDK